ncbi:MAG TPA: menaquinone biosynthesis protein [Verrucomicrobiae bacterium]|nr:menaquinone biosynthesis protein [Verrucomicrobiae bacterium]
MNSEEIPKLRLAPSETPEELATRFEREQRAASLQREDRLGDSLQNFRVGSVPYLNAVPLTRGLEDQIVFAPPSQLAEMLRRDELDAALVSVVEVLFNERYDILDGIAVASLGEVKSVFLAHRRPIEEATVIHCDTASLTSVNLLRVLLAERGLRPKFEPLASRAAAALPEFALLIGNPAIEFLRGPHTHEIWDLGAAWYELTSLPFVYAVWALRRGMPNAALRRQLREAKSFGLDTLDYIISSRTEFDLEFRKDYLGWHIHYHLGADEKRGLAKFIELLRKHTPNPVYAPRFVA